MDALIETFHIDLKLMIAQVINFGIVFAVLYFFAIKPLGKVMKERSQKIEEGLKNAVVSQQKLEESHEEYERAVREAKRETQNILTKAKKDAEAKKNELMEKAQAEVSAFVATGKEQLAREKEKMVTEAKNEIAGLVTLAVEKALGEGMSESLDRKVIEHSIKDIV